MIRGPYGPLVCGCGDPQCQRGCFGAAPDTSGHWCGTMGALTNQDGTWVLDVDLDSKIPEKSSFTKVLLGLAVLWAAWKVTR